MPIDHSQLIALSEQLGEAETSKEKLTILAEMSRMIREAQQVYRLVEVVKNQLLLLEAPPTNNVIDAYPHLTALVNERK